jgi:hypothetical protein
MTGDEAWLAAYAPVIAVLTARRSGIEVGEVELPEGHDPVLLIGVLFDLAERLLGTWPDGAVDGVLRAWGLNVASAGVIVPDLRALWRPGSRR